MLADGRTTEQALNEQFDAILHNHDVLWRADGCELEEIGDREGLADVLGLDVGDLEDMGDSELMDNVRGALWEMPLSIDGSRIMFCFGGPNVWLEVTNWRISDGRIEVHGMRLAGAWWSETFYREVPEDSGLFQYWAHEWPEFISMSLMR